MSEYYGIDLHCKKINLASVNPTNGNLEGEIHSGDFENFESQNDLLEFVINYIPQCSKIGISVPGVLDRENFLVKSVNSKLGDLITLGRDLRDKGYDITLENDVISEGLASSIFGHGRGVNSFVLATYSSGHNCVRVEKGAVNFNPEFGHQDYDHNSEIICGCGIKGCLEIYCSGNGAGKMAADFFKNLDYDSSISSDREILDLALIDYNNKNNLNCGWDNFSSNNFENEILSNISGKNVYGAYMKNPRGMPQRLIRDVQIEGIANSLNRMTVSYNPLDIIVLKGGLTGAWEELFEPAIERYSEIGFIAKNYLKKPEILKTNIKEIGIVGGVANYLNQNGY
jgi:hypothetical protein